MWGDGKQKKLLTFFREVPVQEFKTRDDFVEKANERRDEILQRYFSQQRHEQQHQYADSYVAVFFIFVI